MTFNFIIYIYTLLLRYHKICIGCYCFMHTEYSSSICINIYCTEIAHINDLYNVVINTNKSNLRMFASIKENFINPIANYHFNCFSIHLMYLHGTILFCFFTTTYYNCPNRMFCKMQKQNVRRQK